MFDLLGRRLDKPPQSGVYFIHHTGSGESKKIVILK